MTEAQIIAYCQLNGVPFNRSNGRLRVMDISLIPGKYRDLFDERGILKATEAVEPEVAVEEATSDEGAAGTEQTSETLTVETPSETENESQPEEGGAITNEHARSDEGAAGT